VNNLETLNAKQIRFADFYIESGNATESYLKAGYTVERTTAEVNASRLLRNAKVKEYINERNQLLDEEQIAA
jgi:phage terminase small subunit